ncbi:Nif3-like dinuclear metal center hexameric protein [Clostridium estertheticum]|uniref:Nif3-like dinuclear metal center hexameric protein n=1 Tax=Clostridium estertheticum TaxID=238834 RepID=UPI0013E984C6|nr:Nif3-like dinuclear metal center hexameric protein [Clostridium estertheticum]MBZ9687391.1 Nif3-like dinuclear metal center hexameric protein [Clostridium estertheticum]
MLIKDFENFIIDTFTKEKLEIVKEKNEYGFTNIGSEEVLKLGYCTNLTIESALEAVKNNVNLLITHHDAWEWMSGMKEDVLDILKQSHITHFYIHLPLDDAEFGNNTSILKKLGFKVIDKFSNDDGMYCGRIGEIDEPIEFEKLVNRIELLLEEPIRKWRNNERLIKRIGVVTGAGFSAIDIKDAVKLGCDAYFTGEKILYTVQYAQYSKINLLVGSHTFTEIFGLESLVKIINERYPMVDIIRIKEEHIE